MNCVIAIGGSGARCLEALVYLCAAGLGPERLNLVVVDADSANGNVEQCLRCAADYHIIRETALPATTNAAQVLTSDLAVLQPAPWNPLAIDNVVHRNLKEFLHLTAEGQEAPAESLARVLYAPEQLEAELADGFLGRPAIGAAVFAWKLHDAGQAHSDPFAQLTPQASGDQQNRLFFFGSVFGGTGAAAMPTLPRLIRQRFGKERPVSCGGALLLPYFNFNDQNLHNRSLYAHPAEFPANTRAALNYYHDHLNGVDERVYEKLYVLGSDRGRELGSQYCAGGSQQNNPPHVVEMLAALAATEFCGEERHGERQLPLVMAGREEKAVPATEAPPFTWEDVPRVSEVRTRLGLLERMCLAYDKLLGPKLQQHLVNGETRVPWMADLQLKADDRVALAAFGRFCTGFLKWTRELHDAHNGLRMELVDEHKAESAVLRGLVIGDHSRARSVNDAWRLMCSDRSRVPESRFGSFLSRLRNACA
jgi:hypothetical protein